MTLRHKECIVVVNQIFIDFKNNLWEWTINSF